MVGRIPCSPLQATRSLPSEPSDVNASHHPASGQVTHTRRVAPLQDLGWIDTFAPLIVPEYLAVNAFYVFLMRQFLMTIPRDFDEAAMVDGATSLRILWSVLLPLIQPAVITVAILSFLAHWGDFFGPLIYLNSKENLTLSLGL